jgi:hypothetical protein
MPDYQKGKIYKLYSVSNKELVYYGSTIQTLVSRLSGHIRDSKRKNYSSKLIIDAGDYKIELVEYYPCINKQQLLKREGEYIKNNICINKLIAGRTKNEWIEDNKEKLAQYKKNWHENNKEQIAEQRKEYYEKNKEHIAEKRKEKYQENKEEILKKNKEYYENNKEEIAEQRKEKVTCDCGCIIRKEKLSEHKKTNKHLQLINDLE